MGALVTAVLLILFEILKNQTKKKTTTEGNCCFTNFTDNRQTRDNGPAMLLTRVKKTEQILKQDTSSSRHRPLFIPFAKVIRTLIKSVRVNILPLQFKFMNLKCFLSS